VDRDFTRDYGLRARAGRLAQGRSHHAS
jgi:hypothetical protein